MVTKLLGFVRNTLLLKLISILKYTYAVLIKSGEKFVTLREYHKWLVGIFSVWVLTLIWITFFWNININVQQNPETLYLLSALAQSLAAIFALVFTISLVVAQLSSRYSHRTISNFFDKWTLGYILLFIISILISLWALTNIQNIFGVKLSLSISTFCIYALLPYFLRFKDLLNPEYVIINLKKTALNQIASHPTKEPEEIIKIENFIFSAYSFKDYDTFNKGLDSLSEIACWLIIESNISDKNRLNYSLHSILERISNIGLSTLQDPRAPFKIILCFNKVAKQALLEKNDNISAIICDYLKNLGIKSTRDGKKEILDQPSIGIFNNALHIGKEATTYKMESTLIQVGFLFCEIGIEATKCNLSNIANLASAWLNHITDYSIEKKYDLTTSGTSIWGTLINQQARIGFETIENGLEHPISWVATYLCNTGIQTLYETNEEASNEIANILGTMGTRACEKKLEVSLESITRCLLDLGKVSINKNMRDTTQSVANGFERIVTEANKKNLEYIKRRSINFLIELGIKAVLKNNITSQDLIVDKLYELNNMGIPDVDIGFNTFESKDQGHDNILEALSKLNKAYNKKKRSSN